MARRKRTRKINGRRIESNLYNGIKKSFPSIYINRYNENRRNRTPCDIELQTKKYNVHIEVKATGTDAIQKGNIRHQQLVDLIHWHKNRKDNISLIAMYFGKKRRFVFIPIPIFVRKFKTSRITYEFASKHGYPMVRYGDFNRILGKASRIR